MVLAARAQVQAAQIALKQARTSQSQNVITAQASLAAAQDTLQSSKNKLSRAKTSADAAIPQAALTLQQAQAAYAVAKSNWDYVQETGNNPTSPSSVNPATGKGPYLKNQEYIIAPLTSQPYQYDPTGQIGMSKMNTVPTPDVYVINPATGQPIGNFK